MKFDNSSNPSRRTALSLMAAAGAAMLVPEALFADDLDPRVSAILTKYAAVDMHNHAPVALLATGEADPSKDPVIDLASEEKRGGFAALCYTYPVDSLKDVKPGEYYNAHIQALNQIDRILERQKMHRVFNLKQLEAAHKRGEPVVIQAAEGAQFIEGHMDRVEEAYHRGLRHLQPVHFADNPGSYFGDVQSTTAGQVAPSRGGLTPFGAQLVKECNRLHIVLDFAHASFETVKGALAATSQPFVVSHTALSTETSRRAAALGLRLPARLIPPEYAKAVADGGGIVGISHSFPTFKDFVDGIKDMVDVIGADHVGIGTDTSMAVPAGSKAKSTNTSFPGQDAGFMYAAANEMLKHGFTPDEVGKIAGGNYCKLFGKIMGDRA